MESTKRKTDDVLELVDAGSASLLYFNPSTLKNQSIDIHKKEFLIGRSKEVDFQVTAQRISRLHCLIRNVGSRNAPKWELIDKNSTLGTFLNGRKIVTNQPTPLKDGDVIYLSDPDVYPIRFITNGCKPAKIPKPASLSDDNGVVIVRDSSENSVIELLSPPREQSDNNIRSKTSLGLFEDTSVKICDNIINNSSRSDKAKLSSNNAADKENNVNEEYKLKLSLLNQKIADQEKEMERLKSEMKNMKTELKSKDEEMERMSKDKEILKFIEETNNELIKQLHEELFSRKRELEAYQEANSEEALVLKTSRTFIELIESELQCSICNEVIVTASVTIPCFHVFCNACIGLWFKQKKECAVCRTPSHMRVPCRILDSFIEKLMELIPDNDYKLKRQQICEERRFQDRTANEPARERMAGDLESFYARQMLVDIMGHVNDRRAQETVTIDLTVADIAAANAAATAAQAAAHAAHAMTGALLIPRQRRQPRNRTQRR